MSTTEAEVTCRVCNDTGVVQSPEPDGGGVYDSACPEPVHDEMAAAEKKREAARPVLVRDWMDLYVFDDPAEIMCPDCDALSPEVENVFAAAKWVEKHVRECPA